MTPGLSVTVRIPATSANLGPGFDCLGLALTLANRVEMTATEAGLRVEVQGEGAGSIAADRRNLVVRAANLLFERIGRRPAGLRVLQFNEIPVGSGLGSSAAAVLAGLLAANALLGEPLVRDQILPLAVALEGHPDNAAAALFGGLCLVTEVSKEYRVEKIDVPALRPIVVLPAIEMTTRAAREALPPAVPLADAVHNLGRLGLLLRAFERAEYEMLAEAMDDRLHQPYRLRRLPGMADAFAAARAAGAAVALSGAGPAAIAFAAEGHEEVAARMSAAFADAGIASRTWILAVDRVGAQVGRP